MLHFSDWCSLVDSAVGNHRLCILKCDPANRITGVETTAAVLPSHYASEQQISRALRRLGKPEAAALVEAKLPTTTQIRSGDLGEIYASEWIDAHSGGFRTPIKRLRWKDHRDMAMRGEDVIGLLEDTQTKRLQFLKAEAKSRAKLTKKVLADARLALDKDDGLPSAHALAFISARLLDLGDTSLADSIDYALLKSGITSQSVEHLLFTFSGSVPDSLLNRALQTYSGSIRQSGVGLYVRDHADFVAAIFEQVVANANDT
jgi:hypothetical protein